MPKTELDRVKVKTLDSQFEYILKEPVSYTHLTLPTTPYV